MKTVLMVGPDLGSKGGVASVQKMMLANPPDGFRYVHMSAHRAGLWGKLGPWFLAMVRLATKSPRVDLAHVHFVAHGSFYRKATLAHLLARKGIPVVLHAHGSQFVEFYEGLGAASRKYLQRVLQLADRIIVLSKFWKEFYVRIGNVDPGKVVVMWNPVDLPAAINPVSTSGPVQVIFMGRLGQRKGVYDLLEATARLGHDLDFQLTLIGDGDVAGVQALIEGHKMGDRVSVRSWVTDEERNRLLRAAQVLLLPSHAEGLPMALLEAMGHGLACITTPVGGIPELVRNDENGLLVSPGRVDEIQASMRRLISDRALQRRLGVAARRSVEHLAIQAYSKDMQDLYERLLVRP